MKRMNWIVAIVMMVFTITSCKKYEMVKELLKEKPVPSAVGTPVGPVVIKNIGTTGGTVVSSDGKVELEIPAGAISGNTDISIQAITNTAPNGVSNAYHFTPDGVKFLKPVIIKIHYTDQELAETLPELMGIAFQDTNNVWYRLKSITNNVANKTISASITHFSSWTLFDVLRLTPSAASVRVNETVNMEVTYANGANDVDDLAPLIPNTTKVIWAANSVTNGNGTVGTISSNNNINALYTAPAKVPASNPVAVSAEIQITFKYQGKSYNKTNLVSNITIIGNEYLLEIVFKQDVLQKDLWVTDSASMDVAISGNTVVITNIKNFSPVSPISSYSISGCTFSYVPENIGSVNITGATGAMRINSPTEASVQFFFKHTGAVHPSYRQNCLPHFDVTSGNQKHDGFPTSLFFDLTANVVHDDALPLPYQILKGKLTLK